MPEIIDPVFAKTSQNARFLLSEYERFGLVFTKTRVYKFGHWSRNQKEVKGRQVDRGMASNCMNISYSLASKDAYGSKNICNSRVDSSRYMMNITDSNMTRKLAEKEC